MSYSEERERGAFVSTALNLQALGAVVGGIIPLIINRDKVRYLPTSLLFFFFLFLYLLLKRESTVLLLII